MSPWNPSYFLFPCLIVFLMSFGMSVGMEKVEFEWEIYNFTSLPQKSGESIESPVFYTADSEIGWTMDLYPRGTSSQNGDYVSLLLGAHSVNGAEINWTVDVKWTIKKAGQLVKSVNWRVKYNGESYLGYPKLVERSKLVDSSPRWWTQSVTIYCEINMPSRPIIDINRAKPITKYNFHYEMNQNTTEPITKYNFHYEMNQNTAEPMNKNHFYYVANENTAKPMTKNKPYEVYEIIDEK